LYIRPGCDKYASVFLLKIFSDMTGELYWRIVKLSASKVRASRKERYLLQIASLHPALKGGACREVNRSKVTGLT
jgi:hypothetical protein